MLQRQVLPEMGVHQAAELLDLRRLAGRAARHRPVLLYLLHTRHLHQQGGQQRDACRHLPQRLLARFALDRQEDGHHLGHRLVLPGQRQHAGLADGVEQLRHQHVRQ